MSNVRRVKFNPKVAVTPRAYPHGRPAVKAVSRPAVSARVPGTIKSNVRQVRAVRPKVPSVSRRVPRITRGQTSSIKPRLSGSYRPVSQRLKERVLQHKVLQSRPTGYTSSDQSHRYSSRPITRRRSQSYQNQQMILNSLLNSDRGRMITQQALDKGYSFSDILGAVSATAGTLNKVVDTGKKVYGAGKNIYDTGRQVYEFFNPSITEDSLGESIAKLGLKGGDRFWQSSAPRIPTIGYLEPSEAEFSAGFDTGIGTGLAEEESMFPELVPELIEGGEVGLEVLAGLLL